MRLLLTPGLALLALTLAGCGDGGNGADTDGGTEGGTSDTGGGTTAAPPDDPESVIEEARETLPTYLDLHTKVIARTCSPDNGVCHNAKEYPDLTTAQAMLGNVAGACNVAVDDPMQMFDGCEELGDELRFPDYGPNNAWTTEIAWTEQVPTSLAGMSGTDVILHLRDPIPNPMNDPAELESVFIWRHYPDESIEMAAFYGTVSYTASSASITIHMLEDQSETRQMLLSEGLKLGDPNQNGVFGKDLPGYLLLDPGSPDTSYLLGRVLGALPGTPMPLANQPLSSAEVLAMTCWIEGLTAEPSAYDVIDYDSCDAAMTFGQGDPESGHAFAADVLPILKARCTGGGCHSGDSPAAGLDLAEEVAHDNLLRASLQDPSTLLVTPGNPTNSYLMMKLWGTGVSGLQMPRQADGPGEPLPDDDLRILEQWIIAGAPND